MHTQAMAHKALLIELPLAVWHVATLLEKINEGLFLESIMLKQSSHYIQQQWKTLLWEW